MSSLKWQNDEIPALKYNVVKMYGWLEVKVHTEVSVQLTLRTEMVEQLRSESLCQVFSYPSQLIIYSHLTIWSY